MEEVAPLRVWEPTSEGAEALARIHMLLKSLDNAIVFINLENWEEINRFAEKLNVIPDPLLKRKVFEYTLKLFYSLIIDHASVAVASNNSVVSSSSTDSKSIIDIRNINLKPPLEHYSTVADSNDMKRRLEMVENIVKYINVNRLSLVSVDCRKAISDALALSQILMRQLATPATLEAPVKEYAEFREDVRDMLKNTEYTTLREICKNRHWTKDKALRYLDSMMEAGEIVVRRHKLTTLIIKASAKVCGTCENYPLCSKPPLEVCSNWKPVSSDSTSLP